MPTLGWSILFLKSLWPPPGPKRKGTRLRSQEPSTAGSASLLMMYNNEHCNNPAQTKSCICRVVSALRLTPGFFTLPPLTMLREWISPPRIHVPARIWDELRCPSLPNPKAEQRLSWGHLCSKRHISKNVPNHRVLTMLCFCCTEPRLYRFPAFKIH